MPSTKAGLNISGSNANPLDLYSRIAMFSTPEMNDYLERKFKSVNNPTADRATHTELRSHEMEGARDEVEESN